MLVSTIFLVIYLAECATVDPLPTTAPVTGWTVLEFAKGELKVCHSYQKKLAYYEDSIAQLASPDLSFDSSLLPFLSGFDVALGDAIASLINGRNSVPLSAVHIPLPRSYRSLTGQNDAKNAPLQALVDRTCDVVLSDIVLSKETFASLGYEGALSSIPYGPPKVRQPVLVYPASLACNVTSSSSLCGNWVYVSWGTPEELALNAKNAIGGECEKNPINIESVVGTQYSLMHRWYTKGLTAFSSGKSCMVIGGDPSFECGERVWFSERQSYVTDCAYAPLTFLHSFSKGAVLRSESLSLPIFQKVEAAIKQLFNYKLLHNPNFENFRDSGNYIDARWMHRVATGNGTFINVPALGSYEKMCLSENACPGVPCREECLSKAC